MLIERNYDYCKRMLTVHKKDRRNPALQPEKDELVLEGPIRIVMPADAGEVLLTAAKDFADYLFTSQNITAFVAYDDGVTTPNTVRLKINQDLGEASERRGHRITVSDHLMVEGYDECGVAQGLYFCEDIMNLREAPFLKKGSQTRKVMFVPRIIMSGYGTDEYPDEYLAQMAHLGFSGIMLWIKGPNEGKRGFLNFKDLAFRASRYGFDIYIQCFVKHDVYPEGEEAQAYYDRLYGDMFAEFPFIKGLMIIGEAAKFASKDPTIPPNRTSGWWPCSDWPLLLKMIRKSVDKVKPNVEIILNSYNWGWVDAELRDQLISNLPKDVMVYCGYEMFENYDLDGVNERCSDYSLRVVKPGHYFRTEAESASRHGIRLGTIANSGGKTWDFGAIPYTPAPYRWAERFEALRDAYENSNLTALIDSIHFGVHPSIISELSKWAFAEPRVDLQDMIPKILAMHFGHEEVDKIDAAMKLWSEALANMVPTNEDQYGALRIGPSHPFYSELGRDDGVSPPQDKFAAHKLTSGMYKNNYFYCSGGDEGDVRIPKEIKSYERVRDYIAQGLELLESVAVKNDELLRLINMGHFMHRTILTALNRKHYFLLSKARLAEEDSAKRAKIVEEMVKLLKVEQQNAIDTIPLVEFDSIIGFEPSIEYVTDKKRLEWKINQIDEEIAKITNA